MNLFNRAASGLTLALALTTIAGCADNCADRQTFVGTGQGRVRG